MKNIIAIILTCTTIQARAQNHIIGINGGITWTNVSSSFLEQSNSKRGVSGGLTYEYFLI